jgi:hypothetical protein
MTSESTDFRLKKLLCVAAVLAFVVMAIWFTLSMTPERLTIYGNLRVGETLRFPSLENMPRGKFYIHLLDETWRLSLEETCIEGDCLAEAAEVVRQGGHLFAHVDSKIADEFGVPPIHDGVGYRFADSLIVVTDDRAKIVAIFRNANRSDIDIALAAAHGDHRLVDKARRGKAKLQDWWSAYRNDRLKLARVD